jgi:hypothetical protein
LTVEKTATNYLQSEDYQKHQFAFENVTTGTGVLAYRCGEQELSHVDEVINGKALWPAYSAGDSLKIYHKLESGWPYARDCTISGYPGGGGDPTSPQIGTADFGPPREVRAIFAVDESLPDAGKTQNPAPVGIGVYDTAPVGLWVEAP